MSFENANALWFSFRNITKWAIESLLRFQYLLNLLHSWSIWCLDLIGYWLHRHLNSSFGKNLNLYSSVGTWLVIALEALVHKELEYPKFWNYRPPLIYNGSSRLLLLSMRSRNCLFFISNAWNVIFHFFDKVITFTFLAKVPREFTQEHQNQFERFGFCIDDFVRMPVILTWAFPKFNIILLVSREEQLEVFQDRYWMLWVFGH